MNNATNHNYVPSEKALLMEELTVKCSSCGGESQANPLSECTNCNAALSVTLFVRKIDDFCNKSSLITTEDKVNSKTRILIPYI